MTNDSSCVRIHLRDHFHDWSYSFCSLQGPTEITSRLLSARREIELSVANRADNKQACVQEDVVTTFPHS